MTDYFISNLKIIQKLFFPETWICHNYLKKVTYQSWILIKYSFGIFSCQGEITFFSENRNRNLIFPTQ